MRSDQMPPTVGQVEGVARSHMHVMGGRTRKLGVTVEIDTIGRDGGEAKLVVEVRVELVCLVGVP